MSRIGSRPRRGRERDKDRSLLANGVARSTGDSRLLALRNTVVVSTTKSLVSSAGAPGASGSSSRVRRDIRSEAIAGRPPRAVATECGLLGVAGAQARSGEQPNSAARSHVGNGAVNGARTRAMSQQATARDTMRLLGSHGAIGPPFSQVVSPDASRKLAEIATAHSIAATILSLQLLDGDIIVAMRNRPAGRPLHKPRHSASKRRTQSECSGERLGMTPPVGTRAH